MLDERSVLALALLVMSCAERDDRPPIIWEGDHLRYGTEEPQTMICGGTFEYADGLVGYLGALLGRPDARVDYYWLTESELGRCGPASACTIGSDVFSTHAFLQHELVHAAHGGQSAYAPLEEGLAEAFGDDVPSGEVLAGDLMQIWSSYEKGRRPAGEWYPLAGNYVSFLRAAEGTDALMDFVRRSSYLDSWSHEQTLFSDVYGYSFEESVDEWNATYPRCERTRYRDNGYDCGGPATTIPSDGSTIEIRVPIDCAAPTVIGPRGGQIWTTVAFEVTTEGSHEFGVWKLGGSHPASVRLRRCGQSCFPGPPDLDPDLDEIPVSVEVGGPGIFSCLAVGRHTMRVALAEGDTGEVVARLRYMPGPVGSCAAG